MTMKLCAGCGIRKEASEFYEEPSKKNADGLAPYCKQCFADYGLRHDRRCSKCGVVKPLTREYWHAKSNGSSGFREVCKDCRIEETSAYYVENAEQKKAYSRMYIQLHREQCAIRSKEYARKNAQRLNEYHRQWNKSNPEKVRQYVSKSIAKRHQARREYSSQYKKNNPEKNIAHYHARRARKLQNGGVYTSSDIKRIYAEQNGLCAYCGIELNGKYHVDHIIPIARGGSNYPYNLCCSCPKCNISKGAKTGDEFRAWRKTHNLD